MLVRTDWLKASAHREMDVSALREEILRRARAVAKPIVIFDLDSTLYEVQPRTLAVLKAWLTEPASGRHHETRQRLEPAEIKHLGYSVRDLFAALDLPDDSEAYHEFRRYWGDHFFSDAFLPHDRPYPGTVEFVRALHGAGIHIVYLTGRDAPGMTHGTRANLLRDGFPLGEGTELHLKPTQKHGDISHKHEVVGDLRRRGEVIASFENEPRNLVMFYDELPGAMHVLADTVCSDHPARPIAGFYVIRW
ncbi:MAG: HAD family hydrolase [Bacteriovoracia bacterium]